MGRCRDCGTCRFFTSGWPRWPLEPGGPFLNRIMFRLPFNMFVEGPATKAQIGFPLALKNLGPGCIHKPDSGHFFQGSINWSALLALEADQWLAEENQLLREFAHLQHQQVQEGPLEVEGIMVNAPRAPRAWGPVHPRVFPGPSDLHFTLLGAATYFVQCVQPHSISCLGSVSSGSLFPTWAAQPICTGLIQGETYRKP